MDADYPTLHLRQGREFSLNTGHPWVFSGAFRELPADLQAGTVVDVVDSKGAWTARGYLNARNSLAFRALTLDARETLDGDFFVRRVEQAMQLRRLLPADVNAYRLIHAEADFLPGLIVDRFDRWLVAQFHIAGAERHREQILDALERVTAPAGILVRDDIRVREREGLAAEGVSVARGEVPETIEIQEHGVRFLVDPWHGQKTGFFLDQREKRAFFAAMAPHFATLLNCFAYTGGFALAALARNPALSTVNVETSASALELARRNYELNGHDPARHEFAALDVNRYLQTQKERALHGYESLNTLAARVVSPGGLLLTCSCSGAVTMDEFEAVVRQGLLRAHRTAQLIASFGPSLDHPTLPGFPEDRYLKALVFRLL